MISSSDVSSDGWFVLIYVFCVCYCYYYWEQFTVIILYCIYDICFLFNWIVLYEGLNDWMIICFLECVVFVF